MGKDPPAASALPEEGHLNEMRSTKHCFIVQRSQRSDEFKRNSSDSLRYQGFD
jgi:hypothetical protein